MQSLEMPILSDADLKNIDPRLLEALASLNQIGVAINRLGPGDGARPVTSAADRVGATLRLIAESAIKVVPGSSAVIYTYDQAGGAFDLESRVSAGEPAHAVPDDQPRPDGIGVRSIDRRHRVLSYEEADLEIHPAKAATGAKAIACFPLIVTEQVVGVLYVYLDQDRRFSQFELLMLDNFVNQAAMTIYQARRLADIQQNLERKEDELSRLRRAGLLLSSRLGLQETLDAILQMGLEVSGAHYGIFRLMDKGGRHLIAHAIAGEHLGRPQMEALPVDQTSVMGWVAKHRRPVLIHDLQAEPWNRIYYPLDADLNMRSELAVPLIGASGRLEGVLNLESPLVGAFNEQDSHLLQSLATQAVIAIQEVRLLDALQDVARRLLVQPCREVLVHLVELACDLLNGSASAIWTLQEEALVLQVASAGYQRGERLPLYGSLTGQAILDKRPVTASNVREDPRFYLPDLARAQEWDRALIVPLLSSADPEPIGAFSVYSTVSDPGRFVESVWDEKVLSCLAHYAALAVHNAAWQEALRAAQERHAVAETFAAVGDIAANVLHHLNNKVGTIPVRVQGIEDKCRSALAADAYLASNLAQIERSATEAMRTVRESLSHLRPIRLQSVQVSACVDQAVAAARLPSGIRIRCEALDRLPRVRAGERSLVLVFTNLLENASEAMHGEGVMTLDGTAHDGWVEISVSDSGPGIPPELHDRIFEFNFSGRGSTRAGKLGFGLWWVKTWMVRLGGSIAVESDGQRGATFRLRLPCAQ
jgi:signal transduction histidine kinase/putative methionine-R-sulfoxide reductase with GAF domain